MTFSETLQKLRADAGMTQKQLAEKAGLSIATVRDYEQTGKEPTLRSAVALATALGISLDVFAHCSEPKKAKRKAR